MKQPGSSRSSAQSFFLLSTMVLGAAAMGWPCRAQMPAVHEPQGSFHGFLEVRSADGRVVADGEAVQSVHGDRLTTRTVFRFKDGSLDDETTVYTQRGGFHVISDHHVQKGPSFPQPTDVLIDAGSGEVTSRSTGKDGKPEVTVDHLDLPADLSNGILQLVLENLRPADTESTVSMVVMTPKPRLVKVVITALGADTYRVAGAAHKAMHYQLKLDLGGILGLVAPLIGKAPPTLQAWTIGGAATTLAKEVGPLYLGGPVMTVLLASPVWPEAAGPAR